MKYVAMDVETANPKKAMVSIGLVTFENGEAVDEYYTLINPQCSIRNIEKRIHGIGDEDVADAATFAEVWPEIRERIDGNVIVAHNKGTETGALHYELERIGESYPLPEFICTFASARAVMPDRPGEGAYRLDQLCASLHIGLDHHNALSDAKACGQLFFSLMRQAGLSDPMEMVPYAKNGASFNRKPGRDLEIETRVENAFVGYQVFLSGDFGEYGKNAVKAAITQQGGIIRGSLPGKNTDIAVVGTYKPGDGITKMRKLREEISAGHLIRVCGPEQLFKILSGEITVNDLSTVFEDLPSSAILND